MKSPENPRDWSSHYKLKVAERQKKLWNLD